MPARTLFLPVTPLDAYLVVRDRSITANAHSPDVILFARRNACPGGTAVGIRVQDEQVRDHDAMGRYLVDRRVAEQGITRAYQPWHADVETDENARWRGYLDETYNLTLRNLLGAQTPGMLRQAEDDRVEARLIELAVRPVPQTFDLDHLREVHRRLFQDVYPWAGETRTVDMRRPGSAPFAPWGEIESRWDALADRIDSQDRLRGMSRADFAPAAASVYHEVNVLHSFREGNGRSQRVFMDDLATNAGWRFDWTRVRGQVNDAATEAARHGDSSLLDSMMDRITGPHPTRLVQDAANLRRAAFPLRDKGPARPRPRGAGYSSPQGLDSGTDREP